MQIQLSPRTILTLVPFIALLVVLPFPGTVAARLFLITCTFAVALVFCWRRPESPRNFPPARWSIALWIAVCVLSLLYSADPAYSIKELKNEIGYSLIVFFSFFVIGQQRQHVQILLRALAAGFLLIGVMSLYAWFDAAFSWPEKSLQGGVGSFSTYIVTCMPALFWLSIDDSAVEWRWFARALMAFALILAYLTLQRVVWPALLAELIIGLYLIRHRRHLRLGKRRLLLIVAILLAAGLLAFSSANKLRGMSSLSSLLPSSETLKTPIAQQDGSDGDARLPYWPAIVATIAEHPLVGAGFGIGIMKRAYPELVPANYPALWHAHNLILNYAIQTGLPGAAALLIMFFAFARYFWQSIRRNPAAAIAAIAALMLLTGVLLRNQTNDFFRRDMALLFWSLMGIFSALAVTRKPDE